MEIVARGVISQSEEGTRRAVLIFPSVISLSNGTILASWRCGSAKDSDDGAIECCHSRDGGQTWSERRRLFDQVQVKGMSGSLWLAYFTEVEPAHLLAACMWVNREAYPSQPMFNPITGGCLPVKLLLADSHDYGGTWTPWRIMETPADVGPPSLTSPILKLGDGSLVMSVETNKQYEDKTKWYQRVVMFHSPDLGKTWGKPITISQDPTGRIFYWDQRVGVAPDGRLVAFIWIYDSETHEYCTMRRRVSEDGGYTWSLPEDLGIADQPARPAILADGRVVLPWVDRFGTHSILARIAKSADASFDPSTEICIYTHALNTPDFDNRSTSSSLVEQGRWAYGLPYAESLPDGDVLVLYYAGTPTGMSIHWARLRL